MRAGQGVSCEVILREMNVEEIRKRVAAAEAERTRQWIDANSRNVREAQEMLARRIDARRAGARAMIEEGYREIVKDAMLYGTGMPTMAWDEGAPDGDYSAVAVSRMREDGKTELSVVRAATGANDPAIDMLNDGMRTVMEERARLLLGIPAIPPPKPPPPRKEREPLVRPRLLEVDDTDTDEIV